MQGARQLEVTALWGEVNSSRGAECGALVAPSPLTVGGQRSGVLTGGSDRR